MINSPQNPEQPKGDAASAVTMDDVVGALDATAASGIPAAWDTDDLSALGLLGERRHGDIRVMEPSATLDDLAAVHGCVLSGPYLGDGEEVGSYYLFERRKAG